MIWTGGFLLKYIFLICRNMRHELEEFFYYFGAACFLFWLLCSCLHTLHLYMWCLSMHIIYLLTSHICALDISTTHHISTHIECLLASHVCTYHISSHILYLHTSHIYEHLMCVYIAYVHTPHFFAHQIFTHFAYPHSHYLHCISTPHFSMHFSYHDLSPYLSILHTFFLQNSTMFIEKNDCQI